MNAACPTLCTGVLFALGPAVFAVVATAFILLVNWLLSFPWDNNRSS
jgi:hypothetical protein